MRFLDHDHREESVLCGEAEETGGWKDEGREEKVDCMRWKEASERDTRGGNLGPITKGEWRK